MGEISKNLNLDVGSIFVPRTISDILTQVSKMEGFSKKSSTLDFYVTLLEEELRKIDAFKRELPLCTYLLKEAIEKLEEEKLQWRTRETRPVMEEFIPLKNDPEVGGGAKVSFESTDKKNWMSSAQLWNTPVQYEKSINTKNQDSVPFWRSKGFEVGEGSGSSKLSQSLNLENRGGAFSSFKKPCEVKEEKKAIPVEGGLSLSIPAESVDVNVKKDSGSGMGQLQEPHHYQLQKKQRRCWSPDLHSKFVDALQLLGGAQVATPKQIREIMNVEGLTNDEVKSHLQKYRIHVRRVPASSSDFSWMAQDEPIGNFRGRKGGHSSSPQGPLIDGRSSARRGRGSGCESVDEDEDDKSEGYIWKGRAHKKHA